MEGSFAFEGLVDDLLIFDKPSVHRALADLGERMDGGMLLCPLLWLLGGNPWFGMKKRIKMSFETISSSYHANQFLQLDCFHPYLPSIKFSCERWIFRTTS